MASHKSLWRRFRLLLPLFMTFTGEKSEGQIDLVVHSQLKTRREALDFCLLGGHAGLAVLDTTEKMDQAAFAVEQGSHYWIGLTQGDIDNPQSTTYTWDDGAASSWILWGQNQPNNVDREFCAKLWDGFIFNSRCDTELYFICQRSFENPATTTMATHQDSSTNPNLIGAVYQGYYPIIYEDSSLQNPPPDLAIFRGKTRSETECLTVCAREAKCKYTIFSKESLECTAYSSDLSNHIKDSTKLSSQLGTNIRKKI